MGWGHFGKAITGGMQGENVWCDAVVSVVSMLRKRLMACRSVIDTCAMYPQIDAMHALGYSMLIPKNTEALLDAFRQYHDYVKLVLWEDEPWHGAPCMRDPTCAHMDTNVPAPPPNATHLNLPIW